MSKKEKLTLLDGFAVLFPSITILHSGPAKKPQNFECQCFDKPMTDNNKSGGTKW
jgi:hypothetical protein